MTEQVAAKKKREPRPGTRRVTVTLAADEYQQLLKVSEQEMREPNNMLSFLLKDRLLGMLADYQPHE